MRTSVTAFAIMVAMGFGGGAIASAAHAEDTKPAEASKPDKSKKVCRAIVTTGTRFSQRQCRSKEDWEKDAETSRRYLEESQTYSYAREGGMETGAGGASIPPR